MLSKTNIRVSEQAKLLVAPAEIKTPAFTFSDEVVESMTHLITRINRDAPLPNRLSIVAALRGEGVTYISRALAITLTRDMGARVCLVDLNWWYPSDSLPISSENGGLAAVLSGEATLGDVLVHTGWPNLNFLPAGKVARQDRPALARSQVLRNVLSELNHSYDHLILDIPAILATADAVPLASLGTACCLVVRHGATWAEDVKLALDEIDHLPILGVVMNKVNLATPSLFVKLISAM